MNAPSVRIETAALPDLAMLAAVLADRGIDHDTLQVGTAGGNPTISDGNRVFIKTAKPVDGHRLSAEVVHATEAALRGVRAPVSLSEPIDVPLVDGTVDTGTVWGFLPGGSLHPQRCTKWDIASLGSELRKLNSSEPWPELESFSTRPLVDRVQDRVDRYPGDAHTLMALTHEAIDRVEGFLDPTAFVPIHADAHFENARKVNGQVVLANWGSALLGPREYEMERLHRTLIRQYGRQLRWVLFKTTFGDAHLLDNTLFDALCSLRLLSWISYATTFDIPQFHFDALIFDTAEHEAGRTRFDWARHLGALNAFNFSPGDSK